MAFLTLSNNQKENRKKLEALIEDVYKNGSGTLHIQNPDPLPSPITKKKIVRGIVSIYGGGFDNRLMNHTAIIVEFGQCDFKKKYTPNPYWDTHKEHQRFLLVHEIRVEMIAWLFSNEPKVGDQFETEINQGIRECEVVKVGRTRVRIEYEMPNAGMMGGYQPILNLFGRKLYRSPRH